MGGDRTLCMMIVFGFNVVSFAISGAFFVVTSLASSGSQKKENSEDDFVCDDVGDVVISFAFSASESQKKERSETDFVCGVTGEETTFLGGLIQSFTTCCIGASCDGTDVVVILLEGKAFSVTTSWTGGDRILHSVTLYGLWAFREMTCWIGSDAIVVSMIGNDGKTCSVETA